MSWHHVEPFHMLARNGSRFVQQIREREKPGPFRFSFEIMQPIQEWREGGRYVFHG